MRRGASLNREGDDLKGMAAARELCARWRCAGILYLAALWPARLPGLSERERFLPKPVRLSKLARTVRELLGERPGPQVT